MKKFSLEKDLRATQLILTKVRNETYAQNLYAALCNMQWQKLHLWAILKGDLWSCSWRSAGSIVADLRNEGDYMNWYCSGRGGLAGDWNKDSESFEDWQARTTYVPESIVTDEIAQDLKGLGWRPVPYNDKDLI